MVLQDYGLFARLSVHHNIAFGPAARGFPPTEAVSIADRFIAMIGLGRFADAYPHQLAGSMNQRVAIARVLANDASVVLMVEPFGALDAMTRGSLHAELLSLWDLSGLTIMFAKHAIDEAILLADRIVAMVPAPGRILTELPVKLPRPRDVASVLFNALQPVFAVLLRGDTPAR